MKRKHIRTLVTLALVTFTTMGLMIMVEQYMGASFPIILGLTIVAALLFIVSILLLILDQYNLKHNLYA